VVLFVVVAEPLFVTEEMLCDIWEVGVMLFELEIVINTEVVPEIISEESGLFLLSTATNLEQHLEASGMQSNC
jgi:hypothetical protein